MTIVVQKARTITIVAQRASTISDTKDVSIVIQYIDKIFGNES